MSLPPIVASLHQCAARLSTLRTDKALAAMAKEVASLRAQTKQRELTEAGPDVDVDAVTSMASRLLVAVARQRLILDLGAHPLYKSSEQNIAVLAVGDVSAGSLQNGILVFPGTIVQRRQWVQKGRSGDGYQTLCNMAVEANGSYSIAAPAIKRTFTGITEEDVRAQATAAGVWAEWTRPDGSDSECISFGFHLLAVQALMAAAALGNAATASPAKRARTSTTGTSTPPHSVSPVTPSPVHGKSPTLFAPLRFQGSTSFAPLRFQDDTLLQLRSVRTATGRAELVPATESVRNWVLRRHGG